MSVARIVFAVVLFVAIHVVQTESGPCPAPPSHPTPNRSADGTYAYPKPEQFAYSYSVNSFSIWEWDELWTDLPERGGRFIEEMNIRTCRR